MQRRQRQHDIAHHQLNRHPEKQSANNPMLRHEPQPPANRIKNPRRRTGNEVVQRQPKHIRPRSTSRDHRRPKQSSRNHLRNVPPKQNTSLQNVQRPSHKPRNPDRRNRIPSTHRPAPRTHHNPPVFVRHPVAAIVSQIAALILHLSKQHSPHGRSLPHLSFGAQTKPVIPPGVEPTPFLSRSLPRTRRLAQWRNLSSIDPPRSSPTVRFYPEPKHEVLTRS